MEVCSNISGVFWATKTAIDFIICCGVFALGYFWKGIFTSKIVSMIPESKHIETSKDEEKIVIQKVEKNERNPNDQI